MYTIGYATKPIATYIEQLQHHGVTVVADIRSVPYSKGFFDYHQEALKQHLQQAGLHYVYLGEELGPRSSDSAICHRSLLVGWSLKHQYDCELQHITHDSALESQSALEQRLMTLTDTVPDLLAGDEAALQLAYQQQRLACAYRRPPSA